MKRIIKIMKSFYFIDTNGFNYLLPVYIISLGIMSISVCIDTTKLVSNYVNSGTTTLFHSPLLTILTIINMSILFIYLSRVLVMENRKRSCNVNTFLLQAPVLHKDIYNTAFAILQIESIPFFFAVIYFLGLNIFISSSDFISAYAGFFILIYCIWSITMSISIGFSSLSFKKYLAFRFLIPILMVVSFLSMKYLQSIPNVQLGTLVTQQNMFSGLGPKLSSILMACRHIGGIYGLIVMICSFILSYLLGCKLPLKISEKEGY